MSQYSLDVFLLVVFGDGDISATWLEIDGDHLAESLLGRAERIVDDIRDIVLPEQAGAISKLLRWEYDLRLQGFVANSQHPGEAAVQLDIHTLQIRKSNLFLQDHFVEADDEVRVEESTVEDAETKHASNELEVIQVLWVDARVRVDLQRVIVVRRVLEETVEGIEHFV